MSVTNCEALKSMVSSREQLIRRLLRTYIRWVVVTLLWPRPQDSARHTSGDNRHCKSYGMVKVSWEDSDRNSVNMAALDYA